VEPEAGNQAPAPGAATALSAALSPPRSPGGGSTLPLLPSLRRSPRHQAPPASRGGRRRVEPDADPRRAPDAMRAACRADGVADPELPLGFPCGPWLAADDAEAAIHNWCLDSKTGGGGWGISKRSSRPSNTVRGAQIIYACHFYSPNKTCCPWRVSVEDTVDGWTIFGTKLEHNHALTQSIAESNAYASMRAIPNELKDLAKMVARVAPPKVVHRTLVAQWESLGKQVTWNYQDVYNFIGASAAAKAFDATGFANLLAERFKQQGLPYYIDTDESGSLTRAFFALEGGVEAYAQCFSVGEDGIEVNEAAVQYDTTVRVCDAAASSIRPACRPVLGPAWGLITG
jgi:hypothetical protein